VGKKQTPAFEPYWINNPAAVTGGKFGRLLVAAETFCGVLVVYRWLNVDSQIGVRDRVILDWELKNYSHLNLEQSACQSALLELKVDMLNQGASPEAVRLFNGIVPLTKQELNEMATKLTKKTTAEKKAPAAKTKAAPKAKAAPAEAKSDDRKIKILMKDHGAREGTKRADMLDTIYGCKTVQEAVDAGVSKSDVSWAARAEYISVS
jgi:hypothetical protein